MVLFSLLHSHIHSRRRPGAQALTSFSLQHTAALPRLAFLASGHHGVPGLLPARTLEPCTHKALERRGGSYGGRRKLRGLFKGKCTCGQLSAKVVSSLPRFCSKRFDFTDAVAHSGPSAHTYTPARTHTYTRPHRRTYIHACTREGKCARTRARTQPRPSTYQFRLGALQKFFHVLRAWSQAPRSGAAKALRGKGGRGLRTGATGRRDALPLGSGGRVPAPRPAQTRGEPRERPFALIREVGVAPGTPARACGTRFLARSRAGCGGGETPRPIAAPRCGLLTWRRLKRLQPWTAPKPEDQSRKESREGAKAGAQSRSQGCGSIRASVPHEVLPPPPPAPLEPRGHYLSELMAGLAN